MNEPLHELSALFARALANVYPETAPRDVSPEEPSLHWHRYRVQPLDMELRVGFDVDDAPREIASHLASALRERTGLAIILGDGEPVESPCPGDTLGFTVGADHRIVLAMEPGFLKMLAMVSKPTASPVSGKTPTAPSSPIEALFDLELPLSICFGRARMSLEQALELREGSTLDLTVSSDSLVDVTVNNRIVARGEMVVVEGNYGVRIKEICSRPGTGEAFVGSAMEPTCVGGAR